jgi:outer membrane lipoprotein-sorting protein
MKTIPPLLLLAVLGPVMAQAGALTTAEEVLEFATTQSASYESFTADLTQSMNMLGATMTMTGTMAFKKPARVRMQLNMPMMGQDIFTTIVIGDDKILWQQMDLPAQRQVMKLDFKAIPADHPMVANFKNPTRDLDPQKQLARVKELYTHELLPEEEWRGQKMFVLGGTLRPGAKLAPPEASVLKGLGQNRVFIGQHDGFMHRLEQYDKAGSNVVMRMEFTNLKLNAEIADDQFQYVPAPTANVMDLTQMFLQTQSQPALRDLPPPPNHAPPGH